VAKFQLVLMLHAHQPVGNFPDVIERAYQDSYLPFIEVLAQHPAIRIGLHYSGPLLEWAEHAHPEYFEKLRALVRSGQVEMVGGGFYEPVLAVIPPHDQHEQITRLADYVEKHFGARPDGLWLTERVWEPNLPSALAPAGVMYTLVDDNHFLGAGFELDQMHGYYMAEDQGHVVKLIPGLKALRYTIPFRAPGDTTSFLRDAAQKHPSGFAAMGDDLEKFGSWPETHKHCYDDGWLTNFFSEIERCSDWLETATPSAAFKGRAASGRADLPTASYTEMMEWSLPTRARTLYHGLVYEFESRPNALPFLRGGTWRNFFTKYSEANLLHKKMLHVSTRVRSMVRSRQKEEAAAEMEQAKTLLLQGECNDAYWHGVFGGLYMPHLRTAVLQPLSRAEAMADAKTHRKKEFTHAERLDFDADGNEEVYLTSDRYAALVDPSDGGTVSMIDFRGVNVPLINSLMRRPEAYHDSVRKLKQGKDGVAEAVSIHDIRRAKEDGLERWLIYDRWRRTAFRTLLFSTAKSFDDYVAVRLEEDEALAGGRYCASEVTPTSVTLVSRGSTQWSVTKILAFVRTSDGFGITCDVALRRTGPGPAAIQIALESIVNFLAPAAADRYFDASGQRFALRWSSVTAANPLRIVDDWQKAGVTLSASGAREFWVTPIETVSESEDGFERIYQGSQIAAVWPVSLDHGEEWKAQLRYTAFRAE
jgi:4-alpha-glucanotransferase